MSTPIVYRSSDTSAPALSGTKGTLTALLKACLVTGYGTQATVTLTSTGTNPADGDTVTIGSTVYRFKTALVQAYDVLIGATATDSLTNLKAAINKEAGEGTLYGTGTVIHPSVTAGAVTGTPSLPVTSIKYGPATNSIASTEASSQLSWGGSTLSGGTGKDPAGWTNPFSTTNKEVFRQGGGSQFYMRVDDDGTSDVTNGVRDAVVRGWEVKADINDTVDASNTGPFPTAAQITLGTFWRKSSLGSNATPDSTARVWKLIADDRTVYLIVQTGDVAGQYYGSGFGDIYSFYTSADAYKCIIIGNEAFAASAANQRFGQIFSNGATLAMAGHYLARTYAGTGGSLNGGKYGDGGKMAACRGGVGLGMAGAVAFPNAADGGIYLSPIYVSEGTSGHIRGVLRGMWHQCHAITNFVDDDTFTANTGKYSGRSFIIYKQSPNYGDGSGATFPGTYCFETSAWDTN